MGNIQDGRGKLPNQITTSDVLAHRRLDYEMELASQAQAQFLPRKFPDLKTLSCAGVCVPAGSVGGDFYDFLTLPYQCVGLVLGDIAGKGFAAALQTANLQATLRSLCGHLSHDLRELIGTVSEMFSQNTFEGGYATLFFGEYNDRNRLLRYANCGHPAPFILRADDTIKRLESTGLVLGLTDGWDGSIGEVNLEPGDTLLVYSDGVTEKTRDAFEEFGEKRLIDSVIRHNQLAVSDLVQTVVAAVGEFGGEPNDDTTVVAARCVC
jgi:serine phosphatase RsbU (regulator of sigma subunit)